MLAIVWSWWAASTAHSSGPCCCPGRSCSARRPSCSLGPRPGGRAFGRRRPATIALASLAALGAWAALSAVWSPAPDVAIATGQRILTYALAFGLGIWLCTLLGERLHLALASAGDRRGFAGVLTVVGMTQRRRVGRYLETDATLRVPARLPQRERRLLRDRAVAGAGTGLAAGPRPGRCARRRWRPRRCASTSACLSQSRARCWPARRPSPSTSLFGRDRARRLGWLALAVLPALPIIPSLVDLFQAGTRDAPLRTALDELHAAGRVAALTTLAVAGDRSRGGAWQAAAYRRPRGGSRSPTGPPVVGLVACVIGGSVAFAAAVGDPIDWIDKRVSQLSSGRDIDVAREVHPLLLAERQHAAAGDLARGAARRPRPPPARRRRRRLSLHATCASASREQPRSGPGRPQRRAREPVAVRLPGPDPVRCAVVAAAVAGRCAPAALGRSPRLAVGHRADRRRLLARALVAWTGSGRIRR